MTGGRKAKTRLQGHGQLAPVKHIIKENYSGAYSKNPELSGSVLPQEARPAGRGSGLSSGSIAGIAVGASAVVLLVLLAFTLVIRRMRKRRTSRPNMGRAGMASPSSWSLVDEPEVQGFAKGREYRIDFHCGWAVPETIVTPPSRPGSPCSDATFDEKGVYKHT